MLILMGILGRIMRRHPGQRVELWLLGLTLVLTETIAVSIHRGSPVLQRSMNVVALDAYVLAAATFSWAARGAARGSIWPQRTNFPFFLLPAVPMLILATLYGLELRVLGPYIWITAVSFALGLGYIARTWRRRPVVLTRVTAMHAVIWVPMFFLAQQGRLGGMVYWGLCCLYLLAGFSFRRSMHRRRIGGIAIVAGFVIWAACFALHPWLRGNYVYGPLLDQIWDMQKFFVTIGMLLVLLEDQTERSTVQALHDPLTGLPNRRLFDDRLLQALERSRRARTQVAVFVIDLNGFKSINDSCGHSAGDEALQQAALQLKARIRSSDTLARMGGDEFCVIMTEVIGAECGRLAQDLRDAVARVVLPEECPVKLSASVGYAMFPDDGTAVQGLLDLADARMYKEKRATPPEVGRQSDASKVAPGVPGRR
jgi:diguanylate cyclase (GGDEF)-like protein